MNDGQKQQPGHLVFEYEDLNNNLLVLKEVALNDTIVMQMNVNGEQLHFSRQMCILLMFKLQDFATKGKL